MILKNCRLLPELTEGTDLTCADVVLHDKCIADIVPCGTVCPGKHADLILINGDPAEDISLMYTAPALVIKHGAVVQ